MAAARLASRASSVSTAVPDDKIEVWSDAIYSRVQDEDSETMFTQDDLLGFGIVTDLKHLMLVVNRLMQEFLFKARTNSQGQNVWKWRTQEDAKKFAMIPNREYRLMYELIEDVGSDGIWARSIRYRGHMTENIVKNGLKWLENKGLISEFKSVEHPNKKMYILSSLRPSERATGGPWYTNGELDLGLLNAMQKIVFMLIKDRSTYFSKGTAMAGTATTNGNGLAREKKPTKGTIRGSSPRGAKRQLDQISGTNSTLPDSTSQGPQILPLPAGYTAYPTVLDIAQIVSSTKVTEDPLTQSDMQQIIDLLVWDNRIEAVKLSRGRIGYRVVGPALIPATKDLKEENDDVLGVAQELQPNGMAEIPCGCCPVFDDCEPGSEVSPDTCKYYQEWLKLQD